MYHSITSITTTFGIGARLVRSGTNYTLTSVWHPTVYADQKLNNLTSFPAPHAPSFEELDESWVGTQNRLTVICQEQ